MYARRGLGAISTSAAGAAAGTAIAGPLGTIAGGLIGGLFGGGASYPTQTLTVNTPGGPLQITFNGAGAVQGSAQYIFTQWAQAGRFQDLANIANTGTGPKWDNPSQLYSGYGQVDRNFAAELVQAYQRATDPTTGAKLVPAGTAVVSYQPAGAVQPAGQPGAPAAAGFSPILGLGIGAAAIAAVFMMTGTRRNASRRLRRRNPTSRRSRHKRRRGRRRRR